MFISFEYNNKYTLSAIATNDITNNDLNNVSVKLQNFNVNILTLLAIYNKVIYKVDIIEKLKYMSDLITNKINVSNTNETYNIKFLIRDKYYDYYFVQNNSIIVEEKLVKWSDNNTHSVLYHNTENRGMLYLSYIIANNIKNINSEIICMIHKWFLNLEFLSFTNLEFSDLVKFVDDNIYNKCMLITLCKSFGFDIDDIKININSISIYKNGVEFDLLTEESTGFQRFIALLSILLNNNNKIFIINDMGVGLHSTLLYNLIFYFFKRPVYNNIDANRFTSFKHQLIFTTYDTALMEYLRRDQMYINDSVLTRISDYSDIEKHSLVKLYLHNGI